MVTWRPREWLVPTWDTLKSGCSIPCVDSCLFAYPSSRWNVRLSPVRGDSFPVIFFHLAGVMGCGFLVQFCSPPPPPPDGMRCCRSDWPGLCLFCFNPCVCQPTEMIWAFLFHKLTNLPTNIIHRIFFHFTPPPPAALPSSLPTLPLASLPKSTTVPTAINALSNTRLSGSANSLLRAGRGGMVSLGCWCRDCLWSQKRRKFLDKYLYFTGLFRTVGMPYVGVISFKKGFTSASKRPVKYRRFSRIYRKMQSFLNRSEALV